jgi:hypothetical protein
MDGTTDDNIDQQLKDLYEDLGLHRYIDDNQELRLRPNGSDHPSPICLAALEGHIASSRNTFRYRRNTKALMKPVALLSDKAMAFVKDHGVFLPPIQNSDSVGVRYSQRNCVFRILALEGEKERTRQG